MDINEAITTVLEHAAATGLSAEQAARVSKAIEMAATKRGDDGPGSSGRGGRKVNRATWDGWTAAERTEFSKSGG